MVIHRTSGESDKEVASEASYSLGSDSEGEGEVAIFTYD